MSALVIFHCGDTFFDAFEGFFEVADFVGELFVFVVDDTVGLLDNGEDSDFSLLIELRRRLPANSSLVFVFVDHTEYGNGLVGVCPKAS